MSANPIVVSAHALDTDVQIEFPETSEGKADRLTWSVGEGANEAKRRN